MSTRTTERELEGLVTRLNRTTGNALAPYTRHADGSFNANIGNYHLDYAYGGVKLVQMVSEGGAIRNITTHFDTKSNCYAQIAAYLAGVEDCAKADAARKALLHAAQWALWGADGNHMGANTKTLLEDAIKLAKGD